MAGYFPNPLTILLALLVIPGRQLSLAVLMHEAGHGTLFRTPWLNRWVGQWFCALPTFADLDSYAADHLLHHRYAGTIEDPDLPNYRHYPIGKESFRRKVWRDLSGQTGVKLLVGIIRGAAGITTRGQRKGWGIPLQQLLAQLVLGTLLWWLGIAWVYVLYLGAFLTLFMLIIRVRQIAEHGAVPNLLDRDPRSNTRTVLAPLWQRVLIAPSYVNYHLEHHLHPGVPCYRLPRLHALLMARGYLREGDLLRTYQDVLRHALV
jgi:fatty acid desaturase